MMKSIVLLLTFLLCFSVSSQDKLKVTKKSDWFGELKVTGFYMKGNTNKFYILTGGEVKHQDSIYTLDLIASLDYGETKHIKDQNTLFGDFSADMYHYNLLSPLILQIGEHDYAKGIKFRSQSGGGLKLNFIQHPEHKTSISLALIYDYTDLVDIPGNYDNRTWRLSWRFKTKQSLFDDRLRISNVTFFQPSVKSIINAIWRSETILEAPVLKFLSLIGSYLYTHNDIVSVGRLKSDHKVSFGLSLSSGKQ